jgi:hypothetical protein
MAAQSKQKTPRKLAVRLKRSKPKADDGGMVVFPTASGKLATTWIKNVDNIISEGTGNIDFDRLRVMKEKLETALGLINSRLTEESVNKIKAESDRFVLDKVNHFIKNCVGTVVRLRNRERRFNQGNAGSRSLLVSKACIQDGKRLYIEGLTFDPRSRMIPLYHGETCTRYRHVQLVQLHVMEHSTVSQFQFSVDLDDIAIITPNTNVANNSEYTITPKDGVSFYVIDVGVEPPHSGDELLKFLLEDAERAYVYKNNPMAHLYDPESVESDKSKKESKKCKLKLKRKSGRPEPSSSK